MAITLPTTKLPKVTNDPKNLIIYGLPKVGKTTLLSNLDNCLILDLEEGSDYVEALKIKVHNVKELTDVIKAIKEAGNPYKFIAVDTITALEDLAKPLALNLYKQTPAGQQDNQTRDVTTIAHGAGYGFLRDAIELLINKISEVTQNVIIVGHVKDKAIVTASGVETGNIKDFDLTGKAGRIMAAKSDAIGFIYRDKESNLCINFENGGEATAGARPEHLAGKKIIVAEYNKETGGFTPHWERIYPSLAE